MELFATIALSWPTAVFSVLLMVVIAYWLLAMLGLWIVAIATTG